MSRRVSSLWNCKVAFQELRLVSKLQAQHVAKGALPHKSTLESEKTVVGPVLGTYKLPLYRGCVLCKPWHNQAQGFVTRRHNAVVWTLCCWWQTDTHNQWGICVQLGKIWSDQQSMVTTCRAPVEHALPPSSFPSILDTPPPAAQTWKAILVSFFPCQLKLLFVKAFVIASFIYNKLTGAWHKTEATFLT